MSLLDVVVGGRRGRRETVARSARDALCDDLHGLGEVGEVASKVADLTTEFGHGGISSFDLVERR